MNTNIYYSTVIVFAVFGLILLWVFGFRRLFLDNFRDALFCLRDELYELAQENQLDPNDPAYRGVEALLNGFIRYAHRFTLVFLIFSSIHFEERRASGVPDAAQELKDKIAKLHSPYAQERLSGIAVQASLMLARYVTRSSLLFLMTARLADTLQICGSARKWILHKFENDALESYSADRASVGKSLAI